MNEMRRHPLSKAALQRRAHVFTLLEEICQELELSEAQFERAKQSYEAVAKWLSESDDPLLSAIHVYLHGSGALGTSVKPIGRDEFDMDVIGLTVGVAPSILPATLKKAIGDRLAEHKGYADLLEEKKRCWRLNYVGDFHLDISPTIANPDCPNGGELVPDRKLCDWHPTNPRAYKELFDRRAAMQPRLTQPRVAKQRDDTNVEPFPVRQTVKGILRRNVQLLKRHRDWHFLQITEEVAPISIVITTLAMCSYEYCVNRHVFADELEVLVETIRMMPHFIDRITIDGRQGYAVWNETTEGENFADRWNTEPKRVEAFFAWHAKALSDFEELYDAEGLDTIVGSMKACLGEPIVKKVIQARTKAVSDARANNTLLVAPAIGLTVAPVAAATSVPRNDFFGD